MHLKNRLHSLCAKPCQPLVLLPALELLHHVCTCWTGWAGPISIRKVEGFFFRRLKALYVMKLVCLRSSDIYVGATGAFRPRVSTLTLAPGRQCFTMTGLKVDWKGGTTGDKTINNDEPLQINAS